MVLAPVSYHPSTDCLRSLLRRLEAATASALESENRQLREILERARPTARSGDPPASRDTPGRQGTERTPDETPCLD
jgi:hypothetical protein